MRGVMSDLRGGFFEECGELLEVLDDGLKAIDDQEFDDETINAMFRAVHSIKGGAGAFGLDTLVTFSHAFENVLDDLRSGRLAVDAMLVSLFYLSGDHLADLVEDARLEQETDPSRGAGILRDLEAISGGGDAPAPAEIADAAEAVDDFVPLTLDLGGPLDLSDEDDRVGYHIRFAPYAALFDNGNEAALLIKALGELGTVSIKADLSKVPEFAALSPFTPCVSWQIELETTSSREEVEAVFEFSFGQCDLDIAPLGGSAGADLPAPLAVESPPVAVSEDEIAAPAEDSESAKAKSASREKSGATTSRETIRVELQRIDRLINIAGELVISEAMLRQSMGELTFSPHGAVETAMTQLKQLSGVLQESVMAIRAQPVRGLFQRMSRIVRESAREANKDARLITEGDHTEVDRTVTERLVDPLTQMIRNAVDHGIEPPEVRNRIGKDQRGTVTLSAAHRSGRVVIELRDDGAGINRERVRQLAEEKGLISPTDELNDTEIDNLLFHPGFSTNKEVSNLSGRGVGMDVVKNEIQALGGRVTLHSKLGEGTTVTISLPLTLAVLEGMIVEAAGEILVVPTNALRETVRADDATVHALFANDKVISTRDGLVPVLDLGAILGYREPPLDFEDRSLLLVETDSGRRAALAVDRILDQREVVIKGLEQNYQQIQGIAAATILGDGKIALIVDTDQLADHNASLGEYFPGHQVNGEANHV